MKRFPLNNDALLRSLIKEYVITYRLPSVDSDAGGGTKSTDAEMSTLFKVGLGTIVAFLGAGAIFGSEEGTNDKNPLLSFAPNIANAGAVITSSADSIDITANESRKRRTLNEGGETFNTRYGPVKSDLIDKFIVKNIQTARRKNYFKLPADIKFDNSANFDISLQPAITNIRSNIEALFAIVKKDIQNKATGFPDDFNQLGLTLTDIDTLTDLRDDASINEVVHANAAMSDAVATAIFNQMKYQIINFVGDLKNGIVKTVAEKSNKPSYEQVLRRFVESIDRVMTPPVGDVSLILTGK